MINAGAFVVLTAGAASKRRPPLLEARRRQEDIGPRREHFRLSWLHPLLGKTRKGGYAVKRKTATKRMSRGLKAINQWLQSHLHLPIRNQWEKLKQKVHGHFAYYSITGNAEAL